jgi:glutamate mutase epsilon subunit
MKVEELNELNQKLDEVIELLEKYDSEAKNQAVSNILTAQMRINQIYQEARSIIKVKSDNNE